MSNPPAGGPPLGRSADGASRHVAPPLDRAPAVIRDAEAPSPARWLRDILWQNLPVLLVSGTAASVVAALVAVVSPGVTPVSLLLAALLVAPPFAALVSQARDAVDGLEPRTFSLLSHLRRCWRLALGTALPPALAASLLQVALLAYSTTGSPAWLVPLSVAGCCTVLLVLGSAIALPLALDRPELRGSRLFVAALHIVARRPAPVLGALALLAIGAVASLSLSASLLLLLPAPLALVLVAAERVALRTTLRHPSRD